MSEAFSNREQSKSNRLIIFTDLDGTLLDHESYRFDAASEALDKINRLSIPLIINSSKTYAEIVAIQQELNICQPFISENGAAVHWPENTIEGLVWHSQSFAISRERVLSVLSTLTKEHGVKYLGFAQCDVEALQALTGLSSDEAKRANLRGFSEPLLWQDSNEALKLFSEALAQHQLFIQQGGRFLSVMSEANKANAMQWLCNHLGGDWQTIALGDSPNDELMLNAADIAVVIQSPRSADVRVDQCKQVIHTQLSGPEGWQWAMDKLLPDDIQF